MRTPRSAPAVPATPRLVRIAGHVVLAALLGACSGQSATDRAVDVALAHAGIDGTGVLISSSAGQDGVVDVQIVRDIADQDDSVRALRRTIVVDADGRVVEDRSDHACQPGRGHQDFSTEPCL